MNFFMLVFYLVDCVFIANYSQQNLSPAPAAIIFSLEGVFACNIWMDFLNQFLSELKIFGIVLILFAVIFSQLAPIYGKKSYGRN